MQPYWVATLPSDGPTFPSLQRELRCDVAIVGGGIVGLTAAELLRRAGKSVVVLEARHIGQQATGKSTAKITSQHGLIYRQLAKDFGEEAARSYAQANEAAIRRIAGFVEELGLDCSFERQPAFVYCRDEAQAEALQAEAKVAAQLGLPASFTRHSPLPFPIAGALRFDEQAQFHPARYLIALAKTLAAEGVTIHENTRVTTVESGEPCRLETEGGLAVLANEVIVSTQMPTINDGLLFSKAYPISHPMAAAPIDAERLPEGMFISSEQPSHSLRLDRSLGRPYVVAVGGSYKSGHGDDEMQMAADLERFLCEELGSGPIEYRWTNQDFFSMDGLPFIGRPGSAGHLSVAVGFNAWGITSGTLAGIILADLAQGLSNAWAPLFDASRVKPVAGGPTFLKENVGVAGELLRGHLFESRPDAVEAVPRGEGAVVKVEGETWAVSRREDGQVRALSAICTHMGCVVGWNPIDRTWDCPCHGSRFDDEGRVLSGPATRALERRRA